MNEYKGEAFAAFFLGFSVGVLTMVVALIGIAFAGDNYDEKQNLRCQVMYGSEAVMIRPYDKPMSCSKDIKQLPDDYRP